MRKRLQKWRNQNKNEIKHVNRTFLDCFLFAGGLVLLVLGSALFAFSIILEDANLIGPSIVAFFIGGFNIRMSFSPWFDKKRRQQ